MAIPTTALPATPAPDDARDGSDDPAAGAHRPETAGHGSSRRRTVLAGLVLLAVYGALSLVNDPASSLGTDTGGKVATLEVMAERGSLDPDVGYWAERWDPEGDLHPLYYTSHVAGRWVNATTLPALYAELPLYRLGGYRLALLVPMLAAVAAAFAARALARRFGGDGWLAFWLVGLASPLTIYALDIWEHALGVALVGWAVVALLGALDAGGSWWRGALAGLALGAAASMRTEALIYAAVSTGVICAVLVWRRHVAGAVVTGLTAAVAAVVPLVLNAALEVATVGATIRSGRATATAAGAATAGAGSRAEEALLTFGGVFPSLEPLALALAAGFVALLLAAVLLSREGGDRGRAVVAAAGVGLLYVLRTSDGLGFVPGLLAATPIAAVGLVGGWRGPTRLPAAMAVLALPLVWAFQYTGGAAPQWAGRYILVSGFLLAVAGVAHLGTLEVWARRAIVVAAVGVTAAGVGWLSVRSHGFASAGAELAARPEPVLVSAVAHLPREAGAFYLDRRWLTAVDGETQRRAAAIVGEAGLASFGLVEQAGTAPPPSFDGYRPAGVDVVAVLDGVDLRVTTYEAVGS